MAEDPLAKREFLDAKRKRQSDFLEALDTLSDFKIYQGHYLGKPVTCHSCGSTWRTHEEKMTDVQIATELLVDVFNNSFDKALLITADSDLVPPIVAIKKLFPEKRIVVGFPPQRASVALSRAAHASFSINTEVLEKSVFPDEVTKRDGYILRKPFQWK